MTHHFYRRSIIAGAALVFGAVLPIAAGELSPAMSDAVDRAIDREHAMLETLRTTTPVAETYIQDLTPDTDFGTVPVADHYFLGRVDLARGITPASYLPKDGNRFDLFGKFFSIRYLPQGFAQMMLIDGAAFDRDHYQFDFVRREFLGDLRTIVFQVTPMKSAGSGRFTGNIWVEDKGFNIVRFNGTYSGSSGGRMFMHFDSWRMNTGPDTWLPTEVYSEESQMKDGFGIHKLHFKALTKFWGYGGAAARENEELTSIRIQDGAADNSPQAGDFSPVESLRAWERMSEDNILERMERAGLLAHRGPDDSAVEKVLNTVVNNIAVTNNVNVTPEVRVRVLLTTPLESFTIGHTIVMSRGLLDTLPDEPSLAAVLAHEMGHILAGHKPPTDFAFADRMNFDDARILERFRLARSPAEEEAANGRAIQLLQNSPYKEKLGQAGLYLRALSTESARLPYLIRPLFGDRMVQGHNVTRLAALIESAPQLQTERVDQIAALPLGSRTRLDPWSDTLAMSVNKSAPTTLSEKMPFQIAPVFLHLTYRTPAETASIH